MEKKKLLLVTISVGVFLVIVIGASIMVFSPRNPAPAVTAAAMPERPVPPGGAGIQNPAVVPNGAVPPGIAGSPVPASDGSVLETEQSPIQVQPATADPADMVRNSGDYQTLQIPPSSSSAIQENRFYINNDGTQPVVIERKEGDGNTRVVINVPRPQTVAVPNETVPVSQPSPPPAARTETGNRTGGNTVAANNKPVAKPAAAPVRTTTAPATRSAPQQSKVYDAYWVQTASFSTRTQADKAREILASKGLTAIIENGDVKGETWYRVRVGPYTSQNEADYWLSLIKSINGKPYIDLASSIVWKSYRKP
ncbi:MAG: SPOR domain-containing protein [Treponema sp.]|jgi:DedD protein|nr:SPOR domain-containing protein [Treponema sp.]